jgi:hypothetical protein
MDYGKKLIITGIVISFVTLIVYKMQQEIYTTKLFVAAVNDGDVVLDTTSSS